MSSSSSRGRGGRGGRRRGAGGSSGDVRGPSSALSSFLRERGIVAPRYNPYSGRVIPDADADAAGDTTAVAGGPTMTPPTGSNNNSIASQPPAPTSENGDGGADDDDGDDSPPAASREESVLLIDAPGRRTTVAGSSLRKRKAPTTAAEEKEDEEVKDDGKKKKIVVGKAKAKKKDAKKGKKDDKNKRGKKKDGDDGNDDDDDSDFAGDLEAALGASSKGRTGFSHRRKQMKDSDFNITPNEVGGIRFCSKCLRKFVPVEDNRECVACLTIPSSEKSARQRVAKILRNKSKRVGDIQDGSNVMALRDICLKLIAANISCVEDFGEIPYGIKRGISKVLSRRRLINGATLRLFIGPLEDTVELYDCARLDEGSLMEIAYTTPNVRTLHLADCGQMNDKVLSLIADRCTQISSLTLKGPFLVRDAPFITLFTTLGANLKELTLENAAKLSKTSIDVLASNCPNLKLISLSQCRALKEEGVRSLSQLKCVESLLLEDLGPSITDASLIEVLTCIGPRLKSLALNGFFDMNDDVLLTGIAPHCLNLTSLALRECESITDEGFTRFLNAFPETPKLAHIDISRIVNLKDGSLTSIVSLHGSTLESIGINGLDYLTDYSLRNAFVSGTLSRLKAVDISWVRNFDNQIFEAMMREGCPEIEVVKVYGCNRLTEFTLKSKDWYSKAGKLVRIVGNEFD